MTTRFDELSRLDGVVYRHQAGRKTFATTLNQQASFVKLHDGVGWREIFKNLLQGRLPIIGAKTEYLALRHLADHHIPSLTVLEFGQTGINPARRQSYLVTQALQNTISLEDYCATWLSSPPSIRLKRRLIRKVAELAAQMHASGLNHRDFYLCHVHLDLDALKRDQIQLYLIDLHRAQIRSAVPWRWRVKDIAGLYFSAMRLGLTWRDYVYFVRHYGSTKEQAYAFWQAVELRAYELLFKTHYQRHRSFRHFGLVDKAHASQALPQDAWACDQLIAQSQCLKDDATTTVVKAQLKNGSTVLIKRYNVRSLGKALKRWFKQSRAMKAWRAGVRFHELAILTAKPMALYEKRCGWLRTESYLITEYLDGEEVGHHLASYSAAQQQNLLRQLQRFLQVLRLLRTSHGDMKASNFVLTERGLYCLDLDACRMWGGAWQHQLALIKDTKRLGRNPFKLI